MRESLVHRLTSACSVFIGLLSVVAHAQVSVTTYHNDNSRSGANTQETILTPANVNSQTFGKLFAVPLDGDVYAQPLYLSGITIGGSSHNVVYVATENDSVYAIDAGSGAIYTQTSLIPSGGSTISSANDLGCNDLIPQIGITGTPVIDPSTKTLYVVANVKTSAGTIAQYLHALDVTTLAEKFGGPIQIVASAAGTASDGNGSTVTFNPRNEFQRPALLLENGHVVIGWAGHCDATPWHGWVMSYSASTLAQEAVFNVTSSGSGGAVWMSGGGLAADASGNIYFATGNGTWNGSTDFGDSIVKLGPPSGGQFPVVDYFTPWNQAALYTGDLDVSAGGLVLLPALSSGVQLIAQQGKFGTLVLLNSGNLGKYCINETPACSSSDPNAAQEITNAGGGVWGSPAYWNGNVYIVPAGSGVRAWSFNAGNSGMLSTTPISQSAQSFAYAPPTPSVSANGSTNGIVWVLSGPGYQSTCGSSNCLGLFAYDATNLSNLLYSSAQSATDAPGTTVKYAVPVVANGNVYIGTQSGLSVYGLLSHAAMVATPTFSPAAGSYTGTQSVTLADATPGASIYYTLDGSMPTTSSAKYGSALTVSASTTVQAIAVASGYTNSAVGSATYVISSSGGGSSGTTVSVSLSSADNLYGITTNGTAVPNGGLDGSGYTYSANLLGSSLTWNGSTFTFGAAGTADAVSSKTIALPAGNYSTLNLLGSGVSGNQTNQPFIVTYSDGSTSTFTQSLSDWFNPQSYAGETIVSTMGYRVSITGATSPGPVYLYGYSFALNSAKSVTSLTLPNNLDVVVLAIDLTVSNQAATPTFSPAPGSYSGSTVTVNLADATPGATIYYTTNGATPSTSSAKYSAALTLSATTTVQAIAAASGYSNSAVGSATYIMTAATPTFSPAPGSYSTSTVQVSLADATPGAVIYYTLNGAAPTSGSSKYSAPLTLSATTTIQAIAIAGGYNNSPVASATYTLGAATPTFSPAAGSYSSSTVTVSLADATPGATIYYTTNGATPSTSSSKYSSPLTLSANTTIQAIAAASGYTNSAVASATYGVTAPSPTFSVAAGNYTSTQTVSLSDTIPGASIYYTTNGSTPTTGSSLYSTPISVSATTTIQAIAVASGYNNSAVASATYTITAPSPVSVSLGGAANVYAIVKIGSAVPGTGLDLHGYAYPAQLLGSQVSWAGSTFTFGTPGTLNGIENKTLALPSGSYSALNMLATAVNGDKVNMPFIVTYSDGTTTTFYQTLSDWCPLFTPSYAGQTIVVSISDRLASNGTEVAASCHLYGYSFALNSAKTVASVTLPRSVNNVVVLAIDLTPK